MVKAKKTQRELERIIAQRTAGLPISGIAVFKSAALGWDANFVGQPEAVSKVVPEFDALLTELRGLYDLSD